MARVRKEKKQRNARDTEFEDESSDGPDTPREFEELQEEKRTARKEIIERIKKMPRNRGMVPERDLEHGVKVKLTENNIRLDGIVPDSLKKKKVKTV